MATDNTRIAKNTLFLYFRMFLVMGVSLVTAGVTLRVLGSVDYGLNAVLGGIVAMFSFLNGSLSGAASRNLTFALGRGDIKRVGEIFNALLVTFVGLALVIVFLSETVGLWFFYNKMIIPPERMRAAFWVLQLSVIGVPISLSQVPYNAVLVAHEDMKIYAYVSIADAVVKLTIIYALVISPFDKLITLSFLGFAWSVATIAFYRVYCIRKYAETKLHFCRDRALYKSIFQFAGCDLIGNLSGLAQGQGFNLLLNAFFGPVVNAARGIAYGLQGMTAQFSGNFMIAVTPQIIKSYAQGDYEGMWRLVKRASCFSYYLMLLLALPVWIEADFVLHLWLGKFPDHTIAFFYLIVIVCLLETIGRPLVKVVHATGKMLLGNLTVGITLCLAFPVAYVCLRQGLPPESVFWCAIVSWAVGNVLLWFVLRHYHKYDVFDYVLTVYGRCAIVTAVSVVVPLFVCTRIMQPSIVRMLLTGGITSVSIGLTALYLGMNSSDRNRLVRFVKSKIMAIIK